MNDVPEQPKKKRRRRRKGGGQSVPSPAKTVEKDVIPKPSASVGNHVEGEDIVVTVPLEGRFADLLAWLSGGKDQEATRFCKQAIRTALIKAKNDFEKTQLEDRAFERFKG